MNVFLKSLACSLCLALPAAAQTAEVSGDFTFNYFSADNFTLSDTYTFDDAFTERNGVDVPVPFRIAVPRQDGIEDDVLVETAGGAFLALNFYATDPNTGENAYLETLQFTDATIPLMPNADDPVAARAQLVAQLLENDVFNMVTNGFAEPEILALEYAPNSEIPGTVHMIVSMYDLEYDVPRLSWSTISPHPAQAESYLIVSMINLDLVPATDLDRLMGTMSGRVISSFEYLAE